MKKEYRFIDFIDCEVRAEGDKPKIIGYSALFNVETILGNYIEVIRPGAFTRALTEKQDVRALKNHDPNLILGRTKNGTLTLIEDDKGLRIEIDPADTQTGRDMVEEIRRKDIDQMSFAFSIPEGGDKWTSENDITRRELLDVNLFDISPVTYPAYEKTVVGVRSDEIRSAEEVFKEHLEELQADNSKEQERQAPISVLKEKLRILEKIKED